MALSKLNASISPSIQNVPDNITNEVAASVPEINLGVASLKDSYSEVSASDLQLSKMMEPRGKQADEMQMRINEEEQKLNQESLKNDKTEEADDRKKEMLDNLQKFLDIMRSMDPKI